jgi:hypothetical protein
VALLADLSAFVNEHQHCGDLDGGVEGDRVWMTWYVQGGDQPGRGSRLIASSALLVRVATFG